MNKSCWDARMGTTEPKPGRELCFQLADVNGAPQVVQYQLTSLPFRWNSVWLLQWFGLLCCFPIPLFPSPSPSEKKGKKKTQTHNCICEHVKRRIFIRDKSDQWSSAADSECKRFRLQHCTVMQHKARAKEPLRHHFMKTVMRPWPVSPLFRWRTFTELLQGAPVTLLCKLFQCKWHWVVTVLYSYSVYTNLP